MATQARLMTPEEEKSKNKGMSIANRLLGYATVLAIISYLVWRIGYTLPFNYGYVAVALGSFCMSAS